MKVLISGASGLIGTALSRQLDKKGIAVIRLSRQPARAGSTAVCWHPEAGTIDSAKMEQLDAIVHLAGENIASRPWSAKQKAKIRDSRIKGTKLLADTVLALQQPPKVFICGAAIGFYGSRGSEILDENSQNGTGFLADLCRDWEAAIQPLAQRGIRVIELRTGIVLSARGGPLAKMLPVFKLGGGGIIGDGKQYMSWISLADEVAAIAYLLDNSQINGPVNCVAPNPVTNAEFTATLGQVLHRPTFLPLPAFAAKMILGEMADELLLVSQRIQPGKLLANGFSFQHPDLRSALAAALQA